MVILRGSSTFHGDCPQVEKNFDMLSASGSFTEKVCCNKGYCSQI